MKKIDTILFDLDGTLTTSPEIIIAGYEHVMKQHFPEVKLTEDEKSAFLGRTLINNFNQYTSDEDKLISMEKVYRDYTNTVSKTQLRTYPNAIELIEELLAKNIKIGIVTSKSYPVAMMDMKTVGLDKYFDVVVGYEQTEKHKPEPDSLLKAAKMLKSSPDTTIYIGDHENDIIAANSAKMQSVAVSYSLRFEEALRQNPTYIVDDLIHIKEIV